MAEPTDIRAETTLVLSGTSCMFLDSRVSLSRSGISTVWFGCFHPGSPARWVRMIPTSFISKYYLLNFIITLIMSSFISFLINYTCSTSHSKAKVDWSQHFSWEYNLARHPEQNLWTPPARGVGTGKLRYLVWFQKWGMTSVYLTGHYGETLRRRLMDSSKSNTSWGPINARAVRTTETYFN